MAKLRQIVIDSHLWFYKVGKDFTTIENSDPQFILLALNWQIKNSNPASFERGKWKRTSDGMIFPSDIERYIKENKDKITKKFLESGKNCFHFSLDK